MPDQTSGAYVPAIADLSKFEDEVRKTRGIFIKDVPANTILQIDAADAAFMIVVVDPAERKIKIRGSQYLPEPTDAVLSGSTFGGSMLKVGWIGIGMSLEIFLPGRELPRVTTSVVKTISVVTDGTTTVH